MEQPDEEKQESVSAKLFSCYGYDMNNNLQAQTLKVLYVQYMRIYANLPVTIHSSTRAHSFYRGGGGGGGGVRC